MKLLFAFENPLPDRAADAEVFVATARALAPLVGGACMHVPARGQVGMSQVALLVGMPVVQAWAPLWPAALRHLCCGLTLPLRRACRDADLVYTRNLWVASLAVLSGKRVVFDHYRPWSDQVPPLQVWLYRLVCSRRFVANICHSEYTRRKYLALGAPAEKVVCVRNGYAPARLRERLTREEARQALGLPADRRIAVYTGRLNGRKGLDLILQAAPLVPELLFVLVGSQGQGPIEAAAALLPNVRVVGWQEEDGLARTIQAADVLLIPPSTAPLRRHGTTVLPLKIYLYMASGRPILAGETDDVREVLVHGSNAWLCAPDDPVALAHGLKTLAEDEALCGRLAQRALEDSRELTWEARARRILAVIEGRLAAGPAVRGAWGRAQTRAWLSGSWRWLVHLIRRRSYVLPPSAPAAPSVTDGA